MTVSEAPYSDPTLAPGPPENPVVEIAISAACAAASLGWVWYSSAWWVEGAFDHSWWHLYLPDLVWAVALTLVVVWRARDLQRRLLGGLACAALIALGAADVFLIQHLEGFHPTLLRWVTNVAGPLGLLLTVGAWGLARRRGWWWLLGLPAALVIHWGADQWWRHVAQPRAFFGPDATFISLMRQLDLLEGLAIIASCCACWAVELLARHRDLNRSVDNASFGD